jgi:hypothetical protein
VYLEKDAWLQGVVMESDPDKNMLSVHVENTDQV